MFLGEAVRQTVKGTEGLRILDLCGAPGGKTTHLSSVIKNRGVIFANEVIRTRASVLAENVAKWGTDNIIVTNNDPAAFAKLEGYFDLIVVDAPCSGEGMFRDEAARNEWSAGNAALCSDRQRRILQDVWPSLKPGGMLIYSTCTFNPAENEENINWLAEKYDARPVALDISEFDGVMEISYKGMACYGFYPGKITGEGFFISVVQKQDTSFQKRQFTRRGETKLSKTEHNIVEKLAYGLPERLFLNNDIIWLLSVPVSEFNFLKPILKIIKGGTRLIRMRGNEFTPVHDLSLSILLKNDAFPVFDLDYTNAVAYLRKENVFHHEMPLGWFIVSYRNANLGFVKNLGSRVNNYYPVEWRIRIAPESTSSKGIISWIQ